MPGYWPFYIYLFIYFHFLAIKKSRLIKTHAPKKERGQYPISTPVLTQSERGRALGSRLGQYPVILTEKAWFITWPKTELYIVQGYYCEQWFVITEKFSLNDTALRHDLVSFRSANLVFFVEYQTLARRRPRWKTISDCTWPSLIKMETETVLLKTKRISCLRYLRW